MFNKYNFHKTSDKFSRLSNSSNISNAYEDNAL